MYLRDKDPIVGRAATAKRRLKKLQEMYDDNPPPRVKHEMLALSVVASGDPVTPTASVTKGKVRYSDNAGEVGMQNVVVGSRREGSNAPADSRAGTSSLDDMDDDQLTKYLWKDFLDDNNPSQPDPALEAGFAAKTREVMGSSTEDY